MTIDKRWLLSRRSLLAGLGATALTGLLPRRSHAQAVAPRLLVVHVPEGMWGRAQRPVAGSTNMGPIFQALQPYQSQILALNGLDMVSRDQGPGGDGHHRAVPHMFTGTEMRDASNAGGPSIDQYIAQAIGGDSPHASLQFAVRIVYGDTNGRPLWSAPGRMVPAMQSPWEAYDRIFRDVMPGPVGTAPTAPSVDLRRSAIDYSLSDINTLRARLAASDRVRLDSYHDSLRDIERRLSTVPAPQPATCAPPSLGNAIDVQAERNYPAVGQLQMDMIVAAFQCGLTRVASLQWGNSNDQCAYSWLGINAIGHDLAHNNNNVDGDGAKKTTVYQWYAEQAAYLLEKLSSIPEAGGSMLDNTVILWASEFGESNGHVSNDLLWLLMGNAGGYFRSGRILDLGGKPTNDLLTSLCQGFGLSDETFGNPRYCNGPLAELT
ncbi:MAG: DUF1552 domain-containing protein [Myxococcales bacterium]|nr:DUF1552 domain-containing protein [Myxococcales bacterium]